jgi:hypothetical protein
MKSIWAIARLTIAEGLRMRIVVVFLILLVFLMLRLPYTVEGDATLTGRLQNFLDYSLAAVGVLLSLTTVMLAAATLSQEFERRTIHLIVTKPVARFQILIGKWLGVNLLNLFMLVLCALAIYGFARYIKGLPAGENVPDEREIENVVWTARKAATPTPPVDQFRNRAEQVVAERIDAGALEPAQRDQEIARLVDEYARDYRAVGPGEMKLYFFEGLPPQAAGSWVQVEYQIRPVPLPPDEQVPVAWMFYNPDTGTPLLNRPLETQGLSHTKHQFLIPAEVVTEEGRAALGVINPTRPGANDALRLRFTEPDALQILFKVGSFELNYLKAIALTLLRLAFLSAVALFFGTFVSFPVAVFCGLTWYLVSLGRPFWLESLGVGNTAIQNNMDPYGTLGQVVRPVISGIIRFLFPDFVAFGGSRSLVEGRYIEPELITQAALHTLGLGLTLLFVVGWLVFNRREVADASTG